MATEPNKGKEIGDPKMMAWAWVAVLAFFAAVFAFYLGDMLVTAALVLIGIAATLGARSKASTRL